MLPKAFQEELVFWYYDTYAEHAEEEKNKDEALPQPVMRKEKACELLWERFNTDRLPVPLRHTLQDLYEQRRALPVPGKEAELKEAIKKQEEVANKLREKYQ